MMTQNTEKVYMKLEIWIDWQYRDLHIILSSTLGINKILKAALLAQHRRLRQYS
jgi:hypothetical protein